MVIKDLNEMTVEEVEVICNLLHLELEINDGRIMNR